MIDKWSISTLKQEFGIAMMDRVLDKAEEGYTGWDDPAFIRAMENSLVAKAGSVARCEADSDTYVDIGNLAMFLYAHAAVNEEDSK